MQTCTRSSWFSLCSSHPGSGPGPLSGGWSAEQGRAWRSVGSGEQETGVIGAAAADNKQWRDLNNKYIIILYDRLHKKCYEASMGSDVIFSYFLYTVHSS